MDIKKRSRTELKSYFVTNATPTESNFSEFIDGVLIQKDDGIAKPAGSPLCIEAAGDETSNRKTLQLYESFADAAPEWSLSLRPRVVASNPATQRRGLAISDPTGASRLFIDRATGNVGIGTIEPTARLHVAGDLQIDGTLKIPGGLAIPAGQPVRGVPIVDFRSLDLTAQNITGNFASVNGSTTFTQRVVRAEVFVKSYDMWFTTPGLLGERPVNRMKIVPRCTPSDNRVDVNLTAGWRDTSGNMDDAYSWSISLVVVAVLENAV